MSEAMTDIDRIYTDKVPDLKRAEVRLRILLEEIVATIEDKKLVRSEVRSIRIKELSSLRRKMRDKGWNASEALSHCSDLIGGRVVCNNVEDAYRFAELLKERIPTIMGESELQVQDHIQDPIKGGYRAIHMNFHLDLCASPFRVDLVPCEVQIRSRLQDAWAELSHGDIYKQHNLPEDLRARAKDLAEVLSAADRIASDIRLSVLRETASLADHPDLDCISTDGLAFAFKQVFGRSPPDYAVRQALDLCDQLSLKGLEDLPKVLGKIEFRDRTSSAYRSIFNVPIDSNSILLAAIYAVARGEDRAIKWIRQIARRDKQEVEQFAKREILSSLPATIDELLELLEDSSTNPNVEGWADALGAVNECAVCGTAVVQPYAMAEELVHYYNVPHSRTDDAHKRIERALRDSDIEVGGWGDGTLCAYHNEQASKEV